MVMMLKELHIDDVVPDKNQPRKIFDEIKLRKLAESIKQNGLLHPILVRPLKDGKFQIVHGERRFRACKLIGMRTIPAEIRELSDKEVVEIQLVENLQRENLNPIEEAEAYARLIKEFGYTHEEIGRKIGRTRQYVSNQLRLLKLPLDVQQKIRNGILKKKHGMAILSLEADKQSEFAEKVIKENLTVREIAQLSNSLKRCSDVTHETFITHPKTQIETQDIPEDALVVGIWVSPETYDALTQLANSKKTTVERLCSELIERSLTK
jgi:ParB family chromosome partitioning protein